MNVLPVATQMYRRFLNSEAKAYLQRVRDYLTRLTCRMCRT
jgi:hypothetical protein